MPADETARLVYADWLDERDDPASSAKSQFLRLTVRLLDNTMTDREERKLQKLAAKLAPDWLGVVSRLAVENCTRNPKNPDPNSDVHRLFEFVCDQRWEEMTPTGDDKVRICNRCEEAVHYCDTIVVAREHARQRHCVAVDLGIIRRRYDLDPHPIQSLESIRGMMRPDDFVPPVDDVSLAREETKRKKQTESTERPA
ncbi:MAG: TIGR02996 domain-containing protein [Planctomycetes bacterium]|nr:TIGR02996 domain-containing protein [Planctomycetota bacterium]